MSRLGPGQCGAAVIVSVPAGATTVKSSTSPVPLTNPVTDPASGSSTGWVMSSATSGAPLPAITARSSSMLSAPGYVPLLHCVTGWLYGEPMIGPHPPLPPK